MRVDSSRSGALPAGGGEMGHLIRTHNWQDTPIGPPADWPQVLHILVDLMLASSQPMFIVWGPERTMLYNSAYREILASKHPALGQAFDKVWYEIWEHDLQPIVARAYAGEALHMDDYPLMMMRKGYLEETHFSFSYTPVRNPDGGVEGFFCPCLEITEQVLEERRARLRAELTERLRSLSSPKGLTHEAAALVARHVGAEQSAYAEIDDSGEFAIIESDWNNGRMHSNAGRHRLLDFGPAFIADLKAGRSIAIGDVRLDPRTSAPEARETFSQRGIRAFLNVPHIRNGRLVAVLAVHAAEPRYWHPADVALVEEVAERTNVAVEGARSEDARRASEDRLRETRDALALATKASSLGWGTWDFTTGKASVDVRGREIMGLEPGEGAIEDWMRCIHPEDREGFESEIGACLREGRSFDHEYRVVDRDGGQRFVHGTGFFNATPDGRPTLGTGFVRDVTDQKRSEQHQNMLMAELDHRVKNILAVVQSIARQSLARGNETGPEAAERLVGRISALAWSHTLLARSRWEGACLEVLVENAIAAYRNEHAARVLVKGPGLKITPKAAQTLTLALHELVTNAAKYGALSRPEGRVTAEWSLAEGQGGGRLVFIWQEEGGPVIDHPPRRKGFGSLLIERTLAYDLNGEVTLDFAPAGLRAVINLPLDKLRVVDGQPERRAKTPTPLAGNRSTLRGKRVLVVEDEHFVGHETAKALEGAGSRVVGPVSTVGEALKLAVTEDFDAAVLDVNLNGELIWPAARALCAREIPVVFATGYSDTVGVPRGLDKLPWIEKPFETDRLVLALAAVMDGGAAA